MVDIEYCSIKKKEEESSFMEEDQFKVLDIQIPKPQLEDDDELLEKSNSHRIFWTGSNLFKKILNIITI